MSIFTRLPAASLSCLALLAATPAVLAADDAPPALKIEGISVSAEQADPEACFAFNHPLEARPAAELTPFLAGADGSSLTGRINGHELCVTGLGHGTSTTVTIREGLTGAGQARLTDTLTRDVTIPDRAPQLFLPSSGSVLPAAGPLGIPVRTVNMDELSARLVRLHPDNLSNSLDSIMLNQDEGTWRANDIANDQGEEIWSGKIDLADTPRNTDHSALLPLKEMAGDLQPGAYLLVVRGAKRTPVEYEWRDLITQTQWVIVTDIGLTAIKGEDGLNILARSLETGGTRPRLSVELRGQNDKVLGTATTDIHGRAKFAPELLTGKGGNRPRSIHARQGSDFAILDIDTSAIDLTRLGVEGGDPVKDLDLHLFAERGIWRAGETVYLTGLLRNRTGAALSDSLPVSLKLLRPDGQEFSRHTLQPSHGGAVSLDIELPPTAPAGSWQVTAHLGQDGPEIGRLVLPVRDFQPPRLAIDLTADDGPVKPGDMLSATVQADYFHGAAGAGLSVSGEFTVTADPKPFAGAWEGTIFGVSSEDVADIRAPIDGGKTDATGKATLSAPVPDLVDVTTPLQYTLMAEVTDIDGRPARKTLSRPFVRDGQYLGIKPGFEDRAPANQPAEFGLVLVDQDGTAQPGQKLDWAVRELRYDWLWSRDQGRWQWQRVTRRGLGAELARGSADSADGLVTISTPALDWGSYELEVFNPTTGAIAAHEFSSGWSRLANDNDTPEQIRVEVDQSGSTDDTIRAFIKPPFAAEVTLMLTDGRTHSMTRREVPAEGAFVEVPKGSLARPGGWLMAMGWRGFGPEQQGQFLPRRAMGADWVEHDTASARLSVNLTANPVLRPRETATVTLNVEGLEDGETAHAVVMAVDEGVLRMTRHKGPGILSHYLDPRRPDLSLHDYGGRLIDAAGLDFARLKQGGDEEDMLLEGRAVADQLTGLPVRAYQVVALSSGPVTVGADGQATIQFDMPDVNTGLRLNAAVWTPERLGEARLDVKLRDPVLVELTRPRFMSPGDIADVSLALNLADGAAGNYSANLTTDGPLVVDPSTVSFGTVETGASILQPVTLSASGGIGAGKVTVSLTGPDGFTLTRNFDLGVRPASPLVTERRSQVMVQGQSSRLDPAQYADRFVPGTLTADLTLSGLPDFGSKALLRSLSRYPYGCTEQTTSKAMPLLVYADRAGEYGLPDQAVTRARVQGAISSLSARQSSDGSFGIWNNRSDGNIWLTSYVLDFLTRAQDDGFVVPSAMMERAQNFLGRRAFSEDRNEPEDYAATAYAAQVLAASGRTDLLSLDRLRWWADARGAIMPGTLAPAQLGRALVALGDESRAQRLFDQALGSSRDGKLWLADYGSSLRDRAAVLTLAAESGVVDSARLAGLAVSLDRDASRRQWLSTQEKSWLLLAARSLADTDNAAEFSLNGTAMTLEGGDRLSRRLVAGDDALMARNTGQSQLVSSLAVTGIPLRPLPEASNGYQITRRLFTPSGEPITGNSYTRGQQIVVVIDAQLTDLSTLRESLIVDLLPAGLEPEVVALSPDQPGYDWLAKSNLGLSEDSKGERVYLATPRHRELRDDRYVAAIQMGQWQPKLRLAYQLRAVTPGTFTAPGVLVEDMYAPERHARSEARTVVVTDAE
ncbi:MAG: alpha-2-macroglobulin family protein [Alphaproteobacteria bacterium]